MGGKGGRDNYNFKQGAQDSPHWENNTVAKPEGSEPCREGYHTQKKNNNNNATAWLFKE